MAPTYVHQGDRLVHAAEELARVLSLNLPGTENDWAESVITALTGVEQAWREHTRQFEGEEGLSAQVDLSRPSLVRQVGDIRREHLDFLGQLNTLRAQVRNAADALKSHSSNSATTALPEPALAVGISDFNALRASLGEFLHALEQHRDSEAAVAIESVTTDLGAGD